MGTSGHARLSRLLMLGAVITVLVLGAFALVRHAREGSGAHARVYWGARVAGNTYGYGDPPWDMRSVDAFESHAGRSMSILHWGQPWYLAHDWPHGFYPFVPRLFDAVRQRGMIPLIDWNSWDYSVNPQYAQPRFRLRAIIAGRYDSYIKNWADGARNWGHPFFLRFDHEMNGDWYPWSEVRNGNAHGEYVAAWRHVHDIFVHEGALNVSWVWCVNAEFPGSIPIHELYPGNAYVDWVAIDGYNSPTSPAAGPKWKSFSQLFRPTYDALRLIARNKPVMIAETSSSEQGGSKAAWITNTLTRELPGHFPRVRALVWFNENLKGNYWTIESSSSSQAAFARGIGSTYFAGNAFGNLNAGRSILPPG